MKKSTYARVDRVMRSAERVLWVVVPVMVLAVVYCWLTIPGYYG